MSKADLFIDIDDTILCQCLDKSGYDLRPGVISQLHCLSNLFNCYWLTHWVEKDVDDLWQLLNASRALSKISYYDWKLDNPMDKAPAVLLSKNFYWLEDPLSTGDLSELSKYDLFDRYIPVDPKGMWGFTRAIRILFDKAKITNDDIKEAGGKPYWFQEPLGDHFDWKFY